MNLTFILAYLLIINILSTIFFIADKIKAQQKKRRIPEKTLHIFEFLGGVFANLVLMYTIRHKNQKTSYFTYTYLALILWFLIFYLIF
jgi:uncharacterized membrane protein YsdA (DUF1294 family)